MKNPLWISENKQSAPAPLLFAAALYWAESIFSCGHYFGQWLVFTYLSWPGLLSRITSRHHAGCRMGGLALFLTGKIFRERERERERGREMRCNMRCQRDVLTAVKSCWNLSVQADGEAVWEHFPGHLGLCLSQCLSRVSPSPHLCTASFLQLGDD